MSAITHLYRYPVKGLYPQSLGEVSLTAGRGIAHDRRWGILQKESGDAQPHLSRERWQPWLAFGTLKRGGTLAHFSSAYDEKSERLTLRHSRGDEFSFVPADDVQRRDAVQFISRHIGGGMPIVDFYEAPRTHFWDYHGMSLSIVNLATVRALSAAITGNADSIDPLRFRANIYIDGLEPWEEESWIDGRHIQFGDGAVCRIDSPIPRCAATTVNPRTFSCDLKIPALLVEHYGHNNLGVGAQVIHGGDIAVASAVRPIV